MSQARKTVTTGESFLHWWHSEWGPGPLISLALPLMISTAFVSLTLFTDRTLLYWDSEKSASAAMGAGSLYWCIICLPTGLLGYVSVFVAQYLGAKQHERVGVAYRHAMRLAWCIVPVLLLCLWLAPWLFELAGHSTELRSLETSYLRVLLLGGLAALAYSVQSGLLTGLGRTKAVLLIDALATIVNLVLDFILIFGFGPIPQMGVLGAAIATAISFWIKVPLAHWLIHSDHALGQKLMFTHKMVWEPEVLRRLFVFGAPSGLQMLAESGAFTLIMLQVGKLGDLPMAATTLALGLNVLAFVPVMGLGIGVGVLVGQRLTEGRIDLAERTVTCAAAFAGLYTGIFAVLLGLFPDSMVSIYAWGTDSQRFEEMRPMLVPLLRIIAIYCVIDGFQIVFVGAIKGAGDTWFVLLATTILSFGVVLAGVIYEHWFGSDVMLWWYVIAIWVFVMALAFGARFFQGRWKMMRVIELQY